MLHHKQGARLPPGAVPTRLQIHDWFVLKPGGKSDMRVIADIKDSSIERMYRLAERTMLSAAGVSIPANEHASPGTIRYLSYIAADGSTHALRLYYYYDIEVQTNQEE